MITIVHNETLNAIDIHMDERGVDLLMQRLQELKRSQAHAHIYCTNDDNGLTMGSPYGETQVFGELILNLLPSDAWK